MKHSVVVWVGVVMTSLLTFGAYAAYNQRDEVVRYGSVTVYTFNLGLSNAHLLVGPDGDKVLVDAGPVGKETELEARLRAVGVAPASIRLLVLSHGHADHAGGARYFQQRYHLPVLAGAGDTAMLRRGHNDSLVTHTGLDRFTRRYIATPAKDGFPSLRPNLVVTDSFSLRADSHGARTARPPPARCCWPWAGWRLRATCFGGRCWLSTSPGSIFFSPTWRRPTPPFASCWGRASIPFTWFTAGPAGPMPCGNSSSR